MAKEGTRNGILLLIINGLHSIMTIYFNTFVVAYLLNANDGNFTKVALYYVVAYITMMILYSLFSIVAARMRKALMIQIAVIAFIGVLFYMAFNGDKINDNVLWIALIYNGFSALYWTAYNAISNQLVAGKHILKHNTFNTVISSLTAIIIPVVFGTLIDYSSLRLVSYIVVGVCILLGICTFLLKNESEEHKKFNLKGYFNECYDGNHKKCFKTLYFGIITYGTRDGICTLVTMLIVLTFKTNMSLGIISSLISLFSIMLLLATNSNKNNSNKKNPIIYFSICLVTIASMLILTFNISRTTIIIFNICFAGILAYVNRAVGMKRSGLIRAVDKKEYIVEHQAVCEICVNIGRIIFYGVLLVASFVNAIWIYQILVGYAAVLVFLYGVSAYILEKEYQKVLIAKEFNKQVLARKGFANYRLIPSISNPNAIMYINDK